jgi:hypothetical protein
MENALVATRVVLLTDALVVALVGALVVTLMTAPAEALNFRQCGPSGLATREVGVAKQIQVIEVVV